MRPDSESELKRAEEKLDDATRERAPRHHLYRHRDVNRGQKSFIEGVSLYNLIWVFATASFFGVVSETLFTLLLTGKLAPVSGMLYGPFNQIYGFGAILLTLALYKFRNRNLLVIFLIGMVLGMAFEYGCSWVQELVFGSTSWDYSSMAGNIGGRTNFLYGIGWGLMSYLYICHFWPWMSEMAGRIPNRVGKPLTLVILAFFVANLSLSAAAVWREKERFHNQPATNAAERWLDKTYPDAVMNQKYPGMAFKP